MGFFTDDQIKQLIKEKKHQNDVSGIEDQVISMYAKGMTVALIWMGRKTYLIYTTITLMEVLL